MVAHTNCWKSHGEAHLCLHAAKSLFCCIFYLVATGPVFDFYIFLVLFFVCLLNSLIQVIKNKRTNLPVRFKEKKMESTVCLT